MSTTCSPAPVRIRGHCAKSRCGKGLPADLLSGFTPGQAVERLGPGAVVLRGFARDREAQLLDAVDDITRAAPFRNMVTPGGYTMSVAMTNCGSAGWVTDRKGYRYAATDPLTGLPWPAIPPPFLELAGEAAAAGDFPGFGPDAC